MHFVIDVGSRSVKQFRLLPDETVEAAGVVNWDAVAAIPTRAQVDAVLDTFSAQWQPADRIAAIGTAAVRRSPALGDTLERACRTRGVRYATVTQLEEAELIRAACPEAAGSLDVVNVGGGSIQVVLADGTLCLMPFGISDLNREFNLDGPPSLRRTRACVAWLADHLPAAAGTFVYTGGERRYLESLGVPLRDDGGCACSDFLLTARRLAATEADHLERLSPFGPGWMRGAVASNCIVEAYLAVGGADGFIASDVNIAHGFLTRAFERAGG